MFNLIRDIEAFKEVSISSTNPVFTDTETCIDEGRTKGGLYGKVRLVQIFQETWDKAIIFDCFFIPLQDVLDLIQPHFLVLHNAAYDLHTINLTTSETWLPHDIEDTMYLSRIKYFTQLKFTFYDCLKYANQDDLLIQGIDKKEEQKSDWSGPLSNKQLVYAAADVIYLAKLYNEVKAYRESLVHKLDIESLRLAVDYSKHGMPVNQKTVQKLKKKFMIPLEECLEKLPVNPRSTTKVPIYLGTKTSDDATLVKLIREGNEKAKLVKTARHCYKAIEFLNRYNRPVIKGFFQPSAALGGRFSCTGGDSFDHANLQQIPEELHEVVEAPEGYSIIYKDYSGLELRMAAAFTGEPTMSRLMIDGEDMHTATAKYIFGVNEVTTDQRNAAKTCNFLLIYGGGVDGLRNTLILEANITLPYEQVKEMRDRWFEMYEYYAEWHAIHKHQIKIYGFVDIETALGRKNRTYKLTDSLNRPIQGSSVEVTKMSLTLLTKKYPDAYIIDTVHDSNLLMSETENADMWGERLSESMINAWKYVIEDLAEPDIPMPGGYETGPIWTFH